MIVIRSIPIRLWLPIWTCITLLLVMSGILIHTYQDQRKQLLQQSHVQLLNQMTALSREMQHHLRTNQLTDLQRLFQNNGLNSRYRYLIATDQQGIIQFSLKKRYVGFELQQTELPASPTYTTTAQQSGKPVIDFNPHLQSFFIYFPYTTARSDTALRPLSNGVIFAQYTLHQDIKVLKQQTINKSLFSLFFVLLITLFLTLFIRYFVMKPIAEMIDATHFLAQRGDQAVMKIEGDGEFATLAENFNVMAAELDEKISALRQAKNHAITQQELLTSFLNALPDLLFVVTQHGDIVKFHSAPDHNLKLLPELFVNKHISAVLPTEVANKFQLAITDTLKNNLLTTVDYQMHINHSDRYFEARISPIKNLNEVAIIVRDVTEQKRQEELIFRHAFYDSLTGLPNRYLVLERLAQMLIEAKRNKMSVVVFFIDLDDFKKVNDSAGHEIGDQLLVEAAKRLKAALREQDTVARLGGDEFIVLLKDIHNDRDISPIANNLVRLFRSPIKLAQREFNVSLSLGIALYPQDGLLANELLSRADSAMYSAKARGRNTYNFYTTQMSEQLNRRLKLEEQLQGALERQEFSIYYQPQFSVYDQSIIGAEALLRWHNPTLGSVSPAEFIPIAEQNGTIIELGKFVMEHALTQAKYWQAKLEQPFRIAINLSPRQFRDPNLLSDIQHIVGSTNTSPKLVELEITEGVLLSGDDELHGKLHYLHAMGFQLSMDDFGTGYSSLSYLRQYPFDVLKIDKAFIQDMDHKEGQELVSAIISMAHGLHLKVVAEGIETLAQLKQLDHFGCDIGQGFLLAKPMSCSEFELWLG
ncbi:EAL domain-containing protein [Pseudoalteromonas fenneropenaei]|uniref:EAL domain-containing protein n=1 Tax=Pseudoalteromonas fenneropenaei TaxID=1737459 RepID=A0ABV7CLX1_9GAMM